MKRKLQLRIEIVTGAIDLIKLVAARGNSNLQSTLELTSDLTNDIYEFDDFLAKLTDELEKGKDSDSIKEVQDYMKFLLTKIEEAIPLINLALTTSGANLTGGLPSTVSPGRLLQASNYVTLADSNFKDSKQQVGPAFDLTLFQIFSGSSNVSWKEEMARCTVKVMRVPSKNLEYSYKLIVTESFDDDRYHDSSEPSVKELDVAHVRRLFFSASSKLLRLEDRNCPVLILKAKKSSEKEDDIEWTAFSEYSKAPGSDSEDEEENFSEEDNDRVTRKVNAARNLLYANNTPAVGKEPPKLSESIENSSTSLSLLEYILRLCALQGNDQQSILKVTDERLAIYLADESSESQKSRSKREASGGKDWKKSISPPPAEITSKLNNLTLTETGLE
ncbi:BA75_01581T0 [Komagataella pastoris]|uniref:BA75_01581T0 n=1 Tax=Komagataella pastoris TaxID=4922 RepID=A0A1B2J6C1_PICPA|nr:BA75_01581T0 [Komagataella pastoris]